MIKGILEEDIMDGLKRLDHVMFSLPTNGGKAALEAKEEDQGGYNFLHELADEYSVPVIDAPEKPFDAESLGSLWHFEDEEMQVNFWGVYNHHFQIGWHPASYELVTRKLDAWWEEHENGIVRPVRSLILGQGRNLRQIAKRFDGTNWNATKGVAALANTETEFNLYWSSEK